MPLFVLFQNKNYSKGIIQDKEFFVVNESNIHLHLYNGRHPCLYFSEVRLLPDSVMIEKQDGSFITRSLEILEVHHIRDLQLWDDDKFCEYVVDHYDDAFRYVRSQSYKVQLMAVKRNGNNLQYIDKQTHELCLEAVKQYGLAIRYAKIISHDICWAALENNIHAYNFIESPTLEMQKFIVKKDKYGISLIKDQTVELCNLAIEYWPDSIIYIHKPETEELLKKKLEQMECIFIMYQIQL